MTTDNKLCSREPTPDMIEAATRAHDDYAKRPKGSGLVTQKGPDFWWRLAWTAMWDAAPGSSPDVEESARELRRLAAENERLSKAIVSGVLGELLTVEETEALLDFIKTLRAAT